MLRDDDQPPDYARIRCWCGQEVYEKTSWTSRNPGRRFVVCEKHKRKGGCGFFRWIDEPMCERLKDLIPALCRRIQELEEVNSMLVEANSSGSRMEVFEEDFFENSVVVEHDAARRRCWFMFWVSVVIMIVLWFMK